MNIRKVMLVLLLVLFSASCSQLSNSQLERKILRIEEGLLTEQSDPPWKRMVLSERMAYYNVPGVSIAIVNDYQIEWTKGYGVLETGTDQAVTTNTLFQTGSTVKPIVSTAALYFVETGDLELDRNVNDYLTSWKLPENELTAQEPVTTRRLLSHNAGLPYIPLFGYAQGLVIPNRGQILNGNPPANSEPVLVKVIPGSQYSYSNGGYLIVEQLLEDVAGKPFDVIMEDIIFGPLGLGAITVKYPLPEDLASQAASGHQLDGNVLPGGWHTFPEMGPGASWWATPSDLAAFYINLMLTYTGQAENIITQEMAIEMLTPQVEDRGLGPWIDDDGGDRFYFGHPGHNHGYKSYLVFYPERGQGLVIMTNSEAGDDLYNEILHSVNNEYGWLRDNTVLYSVIVAIFFIGIVAFFVLRRKRSGIN
ncbi:MAG: serine hydrolase domain-containing protein [Anaerolineales bacterium]